MALTYTQDIKTSQGDIITINAADGDFMKFSIGNGSAIALLSVDVVNMIALLQAFAQAKAADARIKQNAPKA